MASGGSSKMTHILQSLTRSPPTPLYASLTSLWQHLSYRMPTHENSLQNMVDLGIVTPDDVDAAASGSSPIALASLDPLLTRLLALRTASETKGSVYAHLEDAKDLVVRLISHRPLMFMGPGDGYLLRDGKTRSMGGFGSLPLRTDKNTNNDNDNAGSGGDDLVLDEYIEYGEMVWSALLGVSVPTPFLNTGSRYNRADFAGINDWEATTEPAGVYVGLVGARFERPGAMEYGYCALHAKYATDQRGYGPDGLASVVNPELDLLAAAMGLPWFETYVHAAAGAEAGELAEDAPVREVEGEQDLALLPPPLMADSRAVGYRYEKLGSSTVLDRMVYWRRMAVTALTFLREANERAKALDTVAYCHVVGLGLGVWELSPSQTPLFVDAFGSVLQHEPLPNVGTVDFSWLRGIESCKDVASGQILPSSSPETPGGGTKIVFSKRDPADQLTGDHKDDLLVAMYAWDSNSWPGNEYWAGSLAASGDPAAACCSAIPELQNPDINPHLSTVHWL